MADRSASVTWQGSLMDGSGVINSVTSGAFSNLDVSWPARTAEPGGKTSPEELIAAAHAACYSMGLSHGLSGAGTPPQKLEVSATCTFDPPKITEDGDHRQGPGRGHRSGGLRSRRPGRRRGLPRLRRAQGQC